VSSRNSTTTASNKSNVEEQNFQSLETVEC
jgi:hypothetical protein